MNCPVCGQPADKLLEPFPDETQEQYSKRLRREYRRETRPRARARGHDDRELDELVRDLLER